MTYSRRHFAALLGSTTLLPQAAFAQLTPYRLDAAESSVGFTFTLNGIAQSGTMPVTRADIQVDPARLDASTVDVNASKARTGLIFATDALKGASVLDTATYPEVRFVSRRVTLAEDGRLSGGATILGDVTLRGITKPLTLKADLYRERGTDAGDLSTLNIQLTGNVNRSAFGANGFAGLVGDTVTLKIRALIRSMA